jgi:hypothetical protein
MEEDKMNGDFIVIVIVILILFSWIVSNQVVKTEESWYDSAERRYLKKEEE